MWIWWVSCIIHCSNACFTIIYIVFSVNFFHWSHAVHLKNANTRQTADQGSAHTHCITKWGGVRPLTWRSRRVSEAHCLFLTLRSPELHLKVPTPPTSYILSLSSLCTRPWDAERTLSNSADSEKQRVKVQKVCFKSTTPAIYTWHQFPLQSFASYWVYWCTIKYSFQQLLLCVFLSMGILL